MIYLLDSKGIHIVITLVWNVKDLKVPRLNTLRCCYRKFNPDGINRKINSIGQAGHSGASIGIKEMKN